MGIEVLYQGPIVFGTQGFEPHFHCHWYRGFWECDTCTMSLNLWYFMWKTKFRAVLKWMNGLGVTGRYVAVSGLCLFMWSLFDCWVDGGCMWFAKRSILANVHSIQMRWSQQLCSIWLLKSSILVSQWEKVTPSHPNAIGYSNRVQSPLWDV